MNRGFLDRGQVIGYFVKSGDPEAGDMFAPYVWGSEGLGKRLKEITNKNYGRGLKLLLIQFYVEGRFPIFGPDQLTVRNYSTRTKSIAVAIPVKRSEFHDVGEVQRRHFIVTSTVAAIDAVEKRAIKRKLDVNFEELRRDVERIGKEFLAHH